MIKFTAKHLWLAIKQIPRLASHKKIALVDKFGLFELFQGKCELDNLGLTSKQLEALKHPNWQKITQVIENANYCGCQILTYDDPMYPQSLKNIYDPPLVLFALGNTELLNLAQIAIVGSRNASVAGREQAQSIAAKLSEHFVVTSGMALGIDANAHRGVLNVCGHTIAVVATGLDITYPARHKRLQKEILNSNGLIISEFAPGVVAKAGHFPKRNRIISGMCYGVLVVEASMRSGSLITARFALEQGRDVFAMPGSIANPQAKGCHWLIQQGAKLVEQAADIVEEFEHILPSGLNLLSAKEKDKQTAEMDKQSLCNDSMLASVDYEITPIDIIVSRCKLPTNVVLTRLTMLELEGLVLAVPGGYLKLQRG